MPAPAAADCDHGVTPATPDRVQALRKELRQAGLSEGQAEKFVVSLRASRNGSAAHGLGEFWDFCKELSIDRKQVCIPGTMQLARRQACWTVSAGPM